VAEATTTHHLVEQVQAGDRAAYEALFERVADRLLTYVRIRMGARLRGRLEPVDVVQDVYLEAFRDLARFEPRDEGAFSRWLYRIADHRLSNLADHFGARKRQAPGGALARGSAVLDRLRDRERSPSSVCARREQEERLVAAMESLDPDEREALLLRHFQGLSVAEVRESLGKSDATVFRILGRARLKLARLVDPGA